MAADIRKLPFSDKHFGSSYCSHVLEHMPSAQDLAAAWSELHRVADAVYICVPSRASIWAHLVPDHYLWLKQLSYDVLDCLERRTGVKYLVYSDGELMSYTK